MRSSFRLGISDFGFRIAVAQASLPAWIAETREREGLLAIDFGCGPKAALDPTICDIDKRSLMQ
ncbi:hypothetical protein AMJ85_01130 [candidate division BRC1 bacterium SM23_51]|nr:MAG: hypothetical protein AMJ85_01130 [candidate division BRC1 bacterium SM23_51]